MGLGDFGDFGDFFGDLGDLGATGDLGLLSWYSTGGDVGRASGEGLRDLLSLIGDLDGDRGGVLAGERDGDRGGVFAGDCALAGDFGGLAGDLAGDLDPERSLAVLASLLLPPDLFEPLEDERLLEPERSLLKL